MAVESGAGDAARETLAHLYFGKDDAENDAAAGGLLRQGFLKTVAYESARDGRKTLIIGRKGSGKSAICMMLARADDPALSVSVINPDEISGEEIRGFTLPGITAEQAKSMIWRYVLTMQTAKFVLTHATQAHRGGSWSSINSLRKFLVANGELDDLGIHEKFWRVIERIKSSISLEAFGVKVAAEIAAPSPGIKVNNTLDAIDHHVKAALADLACPRNHSRLLLLVDQLEKVWSNDADSDAMVTGLLLASKHIASTFDPVNCVVFLRSDIYDLLEFQDSDKFRGAEMRIDWRREALLDLVQVRAQISAGAQLSPEHLWAGLFPEKFGELSITDYIVSRTLMRPRDIIQFCNLCRDTAEKNGHFSIIHSDIAEAAVQYSSWKLQDLVNEYRVNYPYLGDLFVLFQSTGYVVSRDSLHRKLSTIAATLRTRYAQYTNVFHVDGVLDILYDIGFLGVVRNDAATYAYDDPLRIERHEAQFLIHPCFREALQSVSSVDVRPYEATDLRIRVLAERGLAVHSIGLVRGRRSSRLRREVRNLCDNVLESIEASRLPSEVKTEVVRSLQRIDSDAAVLLDDWVEETGWTLARDVVMRARRYFQELDEKLDSLCLLNDRDEVGRVVRQAVKTLDSLVLRPW
jgi:hypothetical protein